MSSSTYRDKPHTPYGFKKLEQAGRPLLTTERFETIQQQYRNLMNGRDAKLTDIYGVTMEITRKQDPENDRFWLLTFSCNGSKAVLKLIKNEDPEEYPIENDIVEDRIHIEINGVFQLADTAPVTAFAEHLPEHVDPVQYTRVFTWQKNFPFFFEIFYHNKTIPMYKLELIESYIPKWEKEWNDSQLKRTLVQTLQKHAKRTRKVNKIVCFGFGFILPEDDKYHETSRSYVQHLAACTIAKTLAQAQAEDKRRPNKIEIFAQEPLYRYTCKTILGKMDPPIQVLDWKTYEGLEKIDKNTFIVAISATTSVLEPALDRLGPDGPAGLLHDKMMFNAEKAWYGKEITGKVPREMGRASQAEWTFRNQCIREPITDDRWFGCAERDEGDLKPMLDEKGNQRTLGNGQKLWDFVQKLDESGQPIKSKFDTELYLKRKGRE